MSQGTHITVLTVIMVESSNLAHGMDSRKLEYLNRYYFSNIHNSVFNNKGQVDRNVGFRQSAYWCGNEKENSLLACRSALDIIRKYEDGQKELEDDCRFDIGIGICSGEMTNIDGLIIGKAAQQSIALAQKSSYFGVRVLLDERSFDCIKDRFTTRELDDIHLENGIRESIFELVDMIEPTPYSLAL